MDERAADLMAEVSVGVPVNGNIKIAGPEKLPLDELVRRFLNATRDPRSPMCPSSLLRHRVERPDAHPR
jgi:hypothetical protein